jgi:purine-binding chemotaxis protein CheW
METQEMLKPGNCYLSFIINQEIFATRVAQVNKITEVLKMTYLPNTPGFIRGMVNIEGQAVPVVDARVLFNLSEIKANAQTCILIVDIKYQDNMVRTGIMVESVHEVSEIEDGEILPTPCIEGLSKTKEFIYGVVHLGNETIMLIDFDKLFNSKYLKKLEAATQSSLEPVS